MLLNSSYPRLMTNAEKTIYWFMYGKRCDLPPEHWNCRCQVVKI